MLDHNSDRHDVHDLFRTCHSSVIVVHDVDQSVDVAVLRHLSVASACMLHAIVASAVAAAEE